MSTIKHDLENPRGEGNPFVGTHTFVDHPPFLEVSKFQMLASLFYLESFIQHSFRVGLLVTNFLSFLSPENVLISPSFLRNFFTVYGVERPRGHRRGQTASQPGQEPPTWCVEVG